MSFLDQLKQQAQARQAQDRQDIGEIELRTSMAEAACTTVWRYFSDLGRQLDVLQPVSRHRYVLDTRCVLDGLPLVDFAGDIRKHRVQQGPLLDRELVQHVVLRAILRSGREVALSKDFVPEIEKIQGRLAQAGIQCVGEHERDPANGRFLAAHFRFTANIVAFTRVVPLHEQGQLRFEMQNLDGLASVTATFNAYEVTQGRLDELAKWWVGEPHRFLDGALEVRRHEPL